MTPELAEAAFDLLIPEAETAVTRIEAHPLPAWESLMQPAHAACRPVFDAWNFVNHLLAVMNNDEWRRVQQKLQPRVVAFSLRVAQSRPIYEGLLALRAADDAATCLAPVRRRILDKEILNAEHAGVGLPADQQARFNTIQMNLAEIGTRFQNNVLDATKAFSLMLTTRDDVEGLPPALLAVAAQAATASGVPALAESGPWKITLDTAVYLPFMMHSRRREAREILYRASVTRASSGAGDNTPLIEQALALRRELAAILGYACFADLSLSVKTARRVEAVDQFMDRLAQAARDPARREIEGLFEFARANGFEGASLQPWDVAFWAERQRERFYDYNDEELSRYFPFPRVLDGLFHLAERLFGVGIEPADGQAPIWHPDVRFFRVLDQSGAPLAAFYLDPYSRPATKSGGAWMNDFRTREGRPNGSPRLPLAVLVCNQSPPVNGAPPVMRFSEIRTLFHEFGHALQHMLTTVDEPNASGINGIEWDAIEIASQFMENWCYDRDTLTALSRQVETGDPLPPALFSRLLAARAHQAATAMLRQLFFAATDLDLYARYPQPGWPDANAVKERNAQKLLPVPLLPEDRFLCAFTHIFSGGYAAGYYSYKWSEALSADAFAAFEEAGLDHEAAVRATGRRFRDTLLALGGSEDPLQVYRRFRGRDPSPDALLRHHGLRPLSAPAE